MEAIDEANKFPEWTPYADSRPLRVREHRSKLISAMAGFHEIQLKSLSYEMIYMRGALSRHFIHSFFFPFPLFEEQRDDETEWSLGENMSKLC